MPDSNLPPAAQAVANAVDYYGGTHWLTPREVAAIALRAVVLKCEYLDDYGTSLINPDDILAIANDLEA
jgi:hypothetical protein